MTKSNSIDYALLFDMIEEDFKNGVRINFAEYAQHFINGKTARPVTRAGISWAMNHSDRGRALLRRMEVTNNNRVSSWIIIDGHDCPADIEQYVKVEHMSKVTVTSDDVKGKLIYGADGLSPDILSSASLLLFRTDKYTHTYIMLKANFTV